MAKTVIITAIIIVVIIAALKVTYKRIVKGKNEKQIPQMIEVRVEINQDDRLCSKCKTGQASYKLDNHSEICPYIYAYKHGRCNNFEPVEK